MSIKWCILNLIMQIQTSSTTATVTKLAIIILLSPFPCYFQTFLRIRISRNTEYINKTRTTTTLHQKLKETGERNKAHKSDLGIKGKESILPLIFYSYIDTQFCCCCWCMKSGYRPWTPFKLDVLEYKSGLLINIEQPFSILSFNVERSITNYLE